MTRNEGPAGPDDDADQKAARLIADAAAALPIDENVQALHRRVIAEQEKAAADLGIPVWVPKSIRETAAARYRWLSEHGRAGAAQVVLRLATDNRMWQVWKNLTERRTQSSERNYHFAAKPERGSVDLGPALTRVGIDPRFTAQHRAAYFFFEAAAQAAIAPTQVPTKGELTKRAERAEKLVATIDKAVDELAQLSGWPGLPKKLEAAIIAAMEMTQELRAQAATATRKRRRTQDQIYGFVVALHRKNERLYGGDLAGIIATTGNVALDLSGPETLTDIKVRKILGGIKG